MISEHDVLFIVVIIMVIVGQGHVFQALAVVKQMRNVSLLQFREELPAPLVIM